MNRIFLTVLMILFVFLFSCSKDDSKNQVIIGIPSDVETLNPLYAFSVEEGNISELLYLSLVEGEWDSAQGEIIYSPMLAENWKWNRDDNSLLITIKDNVYWSDSVKCSIQDVIYTFDLYSDPLVMSRAYGYFENFYTLENGLIDSAKTFEILSDVSIKIKFKKGSLPKLIDVDHPILPKHFWSKFNREDLPTLTITDYVTNGAYKVSAWEKEASIILEKNTDSFLIQNSSVNRLIFKVIPDYQNRISQLLSGEIDILEDIKTDDIPSLKISDNIIVHPVKGRDFDYIGWNNISPENYLESKISEHKLFGNPKVRKALTMALNRELVVDEYLSGFGEIASSPVSSIFKSIYNEKVNEIKFNPINAKDILKSEGWVDTNGNGIIDKNGVEFQFVLHIPSGNPRREFAASLFKNNLHAIGIEMLIESNELGVFIDNLFSKQYDAWMAAWVVPIPTNLKISWDANLEQTPLNFASFRNDEISKLFTKLETASEQDEVFIYKRIQEILNEYQPYSFLYWIDNITGYNKKIDNISIDPLGTIKHCWKWRID